MTDTYPIPPRLLVAVGGNAIHPEGILGTVEEQESHAEAAVDRLPATYWP